MKKIILSLLLLVAFTQADSNIQLTNKEDLSKQQLCSTKNLDVGTVQQSGCCSWHGGVDGCSGGRIVCNDGSYSPSCTCLITISPLG